MSEEQKEEIDIETAWVLEQLSKQEYPAYHEVVINAAFKSISRAMGEPQNDRLTELADSVIKERTARVRELKKEAKARFARPRRDKWGDNRWKQEWKLAGEGQQSAPDQTDL